MGKRIKTKVTVMMSLHIDIIKDIMWRRETLSTAYQWELLMVVLS